MGRLCIYLHEWLIFLVNAEKYTSPMDSMGYIANQPKQYILQTPNPSKLNLHNRLDPSIGGIWWPLKLTTIHFGVA